MRYRLDCAIWEFTLQCNLRCSHCGSSAGLARKDELTTEECFRLCEDLAILKCNEIALMGGEPFLRKDWVEISQCIKDLGIKLSFVSNGLLIEQVLPELANLNPQVVGISIDGMEQAHDMIRGKKGAFRKSISAINLLRKHKIQVTVITTVSKLNFKDLPRLKELFLKKGINWQLQVAMPFGNFTKENMLSLEDYYSVGMFIAAIRATNPFFHLPVVGAHCFGYYSKILPCNKKWNGCTAGIHTIGITSDGGIVGCLSMGNDRFIEDNIRKRSLIDIWYDKKAFPYTRRFVLDDLGENCKGCPIGEQCKGGCNSVSFTTTSKFHNNPYCFYPIERDIIKLQ
ncbi:MAG: radical SAM protein [Candidatus Hodarchaeota archaeon]